MLDLFVVYWQLFTHIWLRCAFTLISSVSLSPPRLDDAVHSLRHRAHIDQKNLSKFTLDAGYLCDKTVSFRCCWCRFYLNVLVANTLTHGNTKNMLDRLIYNPTRLHVKHHREKIWFTSAKLRFGSVGVRMAFSYARASVRFYLICHFFFLSHFSRTKYYVFISTFNTQNAFWYRNFVYI